MITAEEVDTAIAKLEAASLWVRASYDFYKTSEEFTSGSLIFGSNQPREVVRCKGMVSYILNRADSFGIGLESDRKTFKASFRLGLISVTLKTADNFQDVITAVARYGYLQSKLETDSISFPSSIFQLKRNALTVELPSPSELQATDKLHVFHIRAEEVGWSIQVDDGQGLKPVHKNRFDEAIKHVIEFYIVNS